METARTLVLIAATLATGLIAGLMYAFSIAMMPGLARTDDRTYVGVMQQLNKAILNGWFALSFGGAPLLTAAATVLHLGGGQGEVLPWAAASFALCVAMLVITFGINVPLNKGLDASGDPAAANADPAAVRARFEARWLRWNHIRTLACIAALGCLARALTL
jgi:uncharacterized membrane protein